MEDLEIIIKKKKKKKKRIDVALTDMDEFNKLLHFYIALPTRFHTVCLLCQFDTFFL